MGAWGTGILEDDVALDVHTDFMERYDDDVAGSEIRTALESEYADCLTDMDDALVFWLALALAQWEVGLLQDDVRDNALRVIASGESLERWTEAGEALAKERDGVLKQFAVQLAHDNPSPRPRGLTDEYP